MKWADLGTCLGMGYSGIVFKHRLEPNKVIKLLPSLNRPNSLQVLEDLKFRVADDSLLECEREEPEEYLWMYCSSWATYQMWAKVMQDREVPKWLPKIYQVGSIQVSGRLVEELLNRPSVAQYKNEFYSDLDYLAESSMQENEPVSFYYVVMEYLPRDAKPIYSEKSQRRRQKIINTYFINKGMVVRDVVDNRDNYRARNNGTTVFFDPLACPLPTIQDYENQDTWSAITFDNLFVELNPVVQGSRSYQNWISDNLFGKIAFGQKKTPAIEFWYEAIKSGNYFNDPTFRSEQPSLNDYTPYEIMNSGVVTGNFLQDV